MFFFKFQLFPGFGDPGTYLNEHLPMWQPWKNVNHCKAIMSALIFFQVPCMFYPCNRHLNRLVAFESNRKHHGPTVIVCPSDAFWSMHQKLNVEWCDPRRCSYHLVRVGQPVDVGKRRKNNFPFMQIEKIDFGNPLLHCWFDTSNVIVIVEHKKYIFIDAYTLKFQHSCSYKSSTYTELLWQGN